MNITIKTCETCENCIPIGEGDHVCHECETPIMPISDYNPTDKYLACRGKHYVER